jgi:hypothetical protein
LKAKSNYRESPRFFSPARLLSGAKFDFRKKWFSASNYKNDEKPGVTTAGPWKQLIVGDFANSLFSFCQDRTNVV